MEKKGLKNKRKYIIILGVFLIVIILGLMAVEGLPNEPAVGNNDTYNTGFNGKFSDGTASITGIRDLPDSKYYDLYIYGTTYNDQVAYDRGKIGDLTREFNPNGEYTWNSDSAKFIRPTDPTFIRGDYSSADNDGSNAGIFAFYSYVNGGVNDHNSFRPVLTLF